MGNDIGGPIGGSPAPNLGGGIYYASPRTVHTGGVPVKASTDGTDVTPATTETFIAELLLAVASYVTGFAVFNGSAVAGNLTVVLYDAAGNIITKSASTAQSGTDAFQRIAFAAAQKLPPGRYYVGVKCSSASARINCHPIGNFGASKKTGEAYATTTAITPPTTFTADVGPLGTLY